MMKRKPALIPAVILGVAALTLTTQAGPAVGDDAPDFSLEGSDGKTYKVSDFKGKQAMVVAWYPKALTGG